MIFPGHEKKPVAAKADSGNHNQYGANRNKARGVGLFPRETEASLATSSGSRSDTQSEE